MERDIIQMMVDKNIDTSKLRMSEIQSLRDIIIDCADLQVKRALRKANNKANIIFDNGEKCIWFGLKDERSGAGICKHNITNAYHRKDIEDFYNK